MTSQQMAIVFAGALAGGLVNGLTGFGTALTVLGIWLYAIPPTVAATLVILCSSASQLQTLPMIWGTIRWEYVLMFVVPGVLGVPIGTYLSPHIDPRLFKMGIGVFLVAYTSYVLSRRAQVKMTWGGGVADCAVGFAGGILGGIAGLSGVLPAVWTDMRGWAKEHRRGVLQSAGIAHRFGAFHASSRHCGRGAARHHRRRMARRILLSAHRRPQLFARHYGASSGLRRHSDFYQPMTQPGL